VNRDWFQNGCSCAVQDYSFIILGLLSLSGDWVDVSESQEVYIRNSMQKPLVKLGFYSNV